MQARNPNNIRVIDVSHHQGTIDWLKVATDGVKGVFIKASEGVGYTDPKFTSHAAGATTAGLAVGFYHYARPESGNSAEAEAKSFAAIAKDKPSTLPYVLDVEGAAAQIGAVKLTQWCVTWLTEVEKLTGKPVMIYTGASFAKSYLGAALAKWPLWVAHYGANQPMANNTWDRWAVFQYADNGKVAGIAGNVDMNEMELSYWMTNIENKVDNSVDKEAAQKVIAILGALHTASADKEVQNAAHFAADALRDAARIPK